MAARKSRSRARRVSSRRLATRKVRRASNGGNTWSREEVAFMRKYYRNNETSWVARKLGRTVYSVRYKASDLNIKKSRPSVWKGNEGVTKATKKTRRPSTRKAYKAKTSRRSTSTRRAKSRKTITRRATSRRTKSRRR